MSGDVSLHNVTGPSVEVNSGSGRIAYDGDPGRVGEYLLTSHTGNLDVSIPASAWVEIKARSIKGQSDPEFPSFSRYAWRRPDKFVGKARKDSRIPLRTALVQRQDSPEAALRSDDLKASYRQVS